MYLVAGLHYGKPGSVLMNETYAWHSLFIFKGIL